MKNQSSKYKRNYWILEAISIALTVIPILYFLIDGFIKGNTSGKAVLCTTSLIALVLGVINVVFKYHIRSTLWVTLIGIYYALDSSLKSSKNAMLIVLIVLCATTMVDEFIICPLKKRYKEKYKMRKEIETANGE